MGINQIKKLQAVFLDRDGVLNQAIIKQGKPYPPASLKELIVPKEVGDALKNLKQAGFLLIGATNQPDVARGITERKTVETINQQLIQTLPLDSIRVCYHDDIDQCYCRKPLPGLLLQAAQDYNIDLQNSYMIGDRWKDIEAGKRAGCRTIWLDYRYDEHFKSDQPDFTAALLNDAANWIMQNHHSRRI